MADNFSITVDDVKFQRAIRGTVKALDAVIRPVDRPLSDEVYGFVRAQYSSRGSRGPTGKAWTRKQSTIDRYSAMNKRGFSVINEPMRRTDALYVSEVTRGAPHGVYEVEDNELTLGTSLSYGLIQQRRGQMQYDPTEADVTRLMRIIKRGAGEKIQDAGFDYVDHGGAIPF